GGPVLFGSDSGGAQGQPGNQEFEQANKDCEHFIKDVVNGSGRKTDAAGQKKVKEQALVFAKCMRQHGIDMPDPKFQDGGVQITPGGTDPNDPKFREAQKVCSKKAGLPKPKTSTGGGNGPAGGVQTQTRGRGPPNEPARARPRAGWRWGGGAV